MPTNLTDSSTFDTATGPSAADIRNAANMRGHLQILANRAKFLRDQTTPLADIAALKAIASPADGLIRLVKSIGFYVFDSASALTEAQPFVVQPNAGSGRWLHHLYLTKGLANGLAYLNANQQLVIQGSTNFPTFESTRTVTRRIGTPLMQSSSVQGDTPSSSDLIGIGGTDTTVTINGATFDTVASSSVASMFFAYLLDPYVINGATITSLVATLIGAGGHAGLPARMPRVACLRVNNSGEAVLHSAGSAIVDTSANTTAYQASHTVTATCNQNNVVDKTAYSYYAIVWNEGDTNRVAGLNVKQVVVTQTIADLRPA